MKKLLLLFCFVTLSAQSQIVNIPDVNFKAALLEASPNNYIAKNLSDDYFKIDVNDDGEIQESEALEVSGLHIGNRNISDITGIANFSNLTFLECGNNDFSSLDASPLSNLIYLDCTNSNVTDLNLNGLTNLEYLFCDDNSLTSLDLTGLNSIIDVFCTHNQLTSISIDTGTFMNNLSFNWNQISDLSFLEGSDFNVVEAASNLIFDLDMSSANVNYGVFIDNPLQTVNIKNGIYDYDNMIVEFFILPDSPQFICADEFELGNITSDINNWGFSTVLSSYCSFEPGGDYNLISGTLRLDLENNGCSETDYALPYVQMEVDDGVDQNLISTNINGGYSAYLNLGNFSISPSIENPELFSISPTDAQFSFSDNGNIITQDFCLQPNGTQQDVEVHIFPMGEPNAGFSSTYGIIYKNKGNTIVSGDIEFSYDDSILDYEQSSIPFDNQTSGSLFWNYIDLLPLQTRSFTVTLNLNSPMENPAVNIGDELDFEAIIEPATGDFTPADNIATLNQTVVGSFDPNDITCLEGDIVSPDQIGEYLHYNIRFENTGTAPATFVVIANEIDETQYDLNTLQILNASHDMVTRMVGNKLEFIFDDINLQPDGRGNVVYKIKSLSNLEIGDSVAQQANIFFDFNFPIETNIATTTFDVLSVDGFELDNSVSVYPNPTKGLLYLKSNTNIKTLELFDIQGRKVHVFNISTENTIDISSLSKGVYFLEIATTKGKSVKKIIKD